MEDFAEPATVCRLGEIMSCREGRLNTQSGHVARKKAEIDGRDFHRHKPTKTFQALNNTHWHKWTIFPQRESHYAKFPFRDYNLCSEFIHSFLKCIYFMSHETDVQFFIFFCMRCPGSILNKTRLVLK